MGPIRHRKETAKLDWRAEAEPAQIAGGRSVEESYAALNALLKLE